MISPDPNSVQVVSLRGYLQKTNFHFQAIDFWPCGPSFYLFFAPEMSLAAEELFNKLSMWGGPSKPHPEMEGAKGWEFEAKQKSVLEAILLATRFDRPADLILLGETNG